MARESKTQYIILGMLTQEPMSGYQIKQAILTSTNNFWSESDGQIYPTLQKLLASECVRCKEERTSGGRAKKIYSITAKGKDLLRHWLKDDRSLQVNHRNELLLKLFFGANVDVEVSVNYLRDHQREIEKRIQVIEATKKGITRNYADSANAKYWLITCNYALKILGAKVEWCRESIALLNK